MCAHLVRVMTQVTTASPVGRSAFAAHLQRLLAQLAVPPDPAGPPAAGVLRRRQVLAELAAIEEALTGHQKPYPVPRLGS